MELKFTFEIDDKFMAGILEGVCKVFSYDAASGVSKEQFFRNVTFGVWKSWYVNNEKIKQADIAEKAALVETENLKDKEEKPK